MTLKIDFTGVEVGDFEPIPTGVYEVNVFEAEVKESQTGNKYIAWKLKVAEGDYKDRMLFFNTSLVPNALWKLKQTLLALAPDLNLDGMVDFEIKDFIGAPCKAIVKLETYNGKEVNKVDELLKSDRGSTITKLGVASKMINKKLPI